VALPQAGRPADVGPGPAGLGGEAQEEDHRPGPRRCGQADRIRHDLTPIVKDKPIG
jgi:hypothetical protein